MRTGWVSFMVVLLVRALSGLGPSARRLGGRRLAVAAVAATTPCGQVRLRRGKARLFRRGNPLVYGGAVANTTGDCSMGAAVDVIDGAGRLVGWGLYNPESMYRVRLLGSGGAEGTSEARVEAALGRLIEDAVSLRRSLGLPSAETDSFRIINAEGDGLSGLVVDVLGDCVVVASSASWVEMRQGVVVAALEAHFPTKNIIWRRSEARLKQDGWAPNEEEPLVNGTSSSSSSSASSSSSSSPPDAFFETVVRESGIEYVVDASLGQKTGFFCDQRENRRHLAELAEGRRVLDLYCYSGGFSLNAARHGAKATLGVDSSAAAVALAAANAERNGFARGTCDFLKMDVAAFLKQHRDDRAKPYDIVVCDPPKFAPSVRDLHRATQKYKAINTLALGAVKRGGLLLTCTCSSAMTGSGRKFLETIEEAANDAGRSLTLLRTSGAAPDHTINPAYPEGEYLTAHLFHVL